MHAPAVQGYVNDFPDLGDNWRKSRTNCRAWPICMTFSPKDKYPQ
jgi:hypothetical protein